MRARTAVVVLVVLTGSGCHVPRWPVDAAITSGYGLRLRGAWPDIHRGVDLDVPSGTPVRAMAEARVRFAGVMRGFGNVVWLDHGGRTLTVYAHLDEIRVTQGARVSPGDLLGLSGATGDVTAPHLHFEVWRWGRAVDPVPMMGGLPRG